ncbi:MAG TPA: gas vesicle protein GvpG [Candidatus Limnocylindria bacterium]|nr:gas vesicle protein GvpG [Candidatus Limnocylindria bacterium]
MFGLGKLLTLPYSLPAAGIRWSLNKVIEYAESEMTDDSWVKEELLLLNMRFEDGEIDEAQFRREEAPLLARLSEIKAQRKQQAEEELAALAEGGPARTVLIETPDELAQPQSDR